MILATSFTLREFAKSATAARRGIDNTIPWDVVPNVSHLVATVLQPLRDIYCAKFGRDVPLIITSGYRCPELNQVVGGAADSDHLQGLGADFHPVGVRLADAYETLFHARLPIRYACCYWDDEHIHVSAQLGQPVRTIWKQKTKGKETLWTPG